MVARFRSCSDGRSNDGGSGPACLTAVLAERSGRQRDAFPVRHWFPAFRRRREIAGDAGDRGLGRDASRLGNCVIG